MLKLEYVKTLIINKEFYVGIPQLVFNISKPVVIY